MASYDSPGYTDRTPGGPVNQQGFSAPGSTLPPRPDTSAPISDRVEQGTLGNNAVIAPVGASLANADIVPVGPLDTLMPPQASMYDDSADPLSGVVGVGVTGAGLGNVSSPHHPSSMTSRS